MALPIPRLSGFSVLEDKVYPTTLKTLTGGCLRNSKLIVEVAAEAEELMVLGRKGERFGLRWPDSH